jgi:hypothetical protein
MTYSPAAPNEIGSAKHNFMRRGRQIDWVPFKCDATTLSPSKFRNKVGLALLLAAIDGAHESH